MRVFCPRRRRDPKRMQAETHRSGPMPAIDLFCPLRSSSSATTTTKARSKGDNEEDNEQATSNQTTATSTGQSRDNNETDNEQATKQRPQPRNEAKATAKKPTNEEDNKQPTAWQPLKCLPPVPHPPFNHMRTTTRRHGPVCTKPQF